MASASDIKAGAAYVELYLRDNRFIRGLRMAQQRLRAMGTGLTRIGKSMMMAGGMILAPILGAAKAFASAGDQLHKMSARTGVSAQALSELGYAAELSGSDLDQLGTALFRMRRRIANAATGTGPAVRALDALGLSAERLTQLSPEQQFEEMVGTLGQIENKSLAAQYGFEVFGLSAKQLLPMLLAGTDGIAAMRKEARELGFTLSDEDVVSAAELTDAMTRLYKSLKMVFMRIGAAVAGELTAFANKAAKVGSKIIQWTKDNKTLVVTVMKVAAGVLAAGVAVTAIGFTFLAVSTILGGIIGAFSALATIIGVVGSALGVILTPIGLVVAALVGLGAYLVMVSGTGGKAIHWLSERFSELETWVRKVCGGIADALKAGDISAAAGVLWAGLRVAWEIGIDALLDKWIDFKFAVLEIFEETFSGLKIAWSEFSSWLEDKWNEFWRAFETEEETRKRLMEEFVPGYGPDRPEQEEPSERIGREHAAKMEELDKKREDAKAERKKKLEDAKAALEDALEKARKARKDAVAGGETPRVPPGIPDLSELSPVLAAVTEVRGTFSGRAAGLLGGGGPLDDIRKSNERMAKDIAAIEKRIPPWIGFDWGP